MSDEPISLDKYRDSRPEEPSSLVRLENDVIVAKIDGELTPDAARMLAMNLLQFADEVGGENEFGFGYDIGDSSALCALRQAVDEHLGWASPEEEEDGDYVARVKQVGEQLRKRAQLTVVPRA